MRISLTYVLLECWVAMTLTVAAAGPVAAVGPVAAASAASQKRVLVLYSTRRDAQISAVGDRELPRILEHGLGFPLDYHSEYLDLARFPDLRYQAGLRDFLRVKYSGLRFDLVIAMQDVSLEFVVRNRSDLFPDTPIVFFATSPATRRISNSTGIIAPLNFTGSVGLALELQPEVRQVVVVTGAESRDKEFETLARAQFRSFQDRLAFTYLTGLATTELETRLATVSGNSIIYYLVANRDGAGENLHPLAYLDRLAAVANAPIYCWVDSAMDYGIVGGSLKSQKIQTEAVGQLALRVLRGELADSIPIASPDLNVNQVDWRQLQRWGISEARVPSGTLIMFKEPSAWDRYRVYILGATAVLLAQTALIAALLAHRARRRLAEKQARDSQVELRTSYERIRDLGARLLNAQETERTRIARELHDDISQQLALLEIDLELLLGSVQTGSEELVDEALHRAHGIARSLHDLSYRLHPGKLRLIGLVAALEALKGELSRSEIIIDLSHDNVPSTLPPESTLCLFRIVQEALQNALKYSKATGVSVRVAADLETLTLTIQDDGVGFDVDAAWTKGLGLISMRERLEAIGGTLEIQSRPGAGTRLEARLPLSIGRSPEIAAV